MGVEEDGHAALVAEVEDEVAEPLDAFRVEAVGGFVEQEDLGLRQKRLGEGEALAHAVAVGADFGMDALGEADAVDDLAGGGRIEAAGVAHEDFQVIPAAEVVVEGGCFEDGADFAQGFGAVVEDGDAVDGDVALVGHDHAEDDAEGGAFARAVVA